MRVAILAALVQAAWLVVEWRGGYVTIEKPWQPQSSDTSGKNGDRHSSTVWNVQERRYEMVDAKGQRLGDVAVLTFNLVNYGKIQEQPESVLACWNATATGRISSHKSSSRSFR